MPSFKRIFDITMSSIAIILLLPLIMSIGLLLIIIDGRPVFFIQQRPGLNGKIFRMIKFRTMEQPSGDQQSEDGERITRFGSFLRSSSMDELPELFNVLAGQMSIVGPRPLLVEYLDLYDDYQFRRHEMNPGITGWAQINGRNALEWEEKFKLDVWYVDNNSITLDIKIILKTLSSVILRKNISFQGEVTMKKFEGRLKNVNEE